MPLSPPEIHDDEYLARFLLDRRDVRADSTVRMRAFLPPRDLKLSTYRLLGLNDYDVWNIGAEYVAAPRQRRLVGRADFRAENVRGAGLGFDPDGQPHPNHTNIVDWPSDKDERKEKAQILAETAEYKARPDD